MFAKIRSPLVESSKLNACEIRDILIIPRSSYYTATLANDIPLAAPLLKCFAQSNIRVDVEVVVAVANNNDFVDLFALRRDFGLQRGERIRRRGGGGGGGEDAFLHLRSAMLCVCLKSCVNLP